MLLIIITYIIKIYDIRKVDKRPNKENRKYNKL